MRVLIVDDEPMPGKHLQELIRAHCFEIYEIDLVHSMDAALKLMQENAYEILFLDVELKEGTSFDMLQEFDLDRNTSIIFTTAYAQYAVDAFKVNATDYLIKPIFKEDLINAVRKVALFHKKNELGFDKSTISIFVENEYIILAKANIIHLEANGSYTKVVCVHDTYLSSKSLRVFESKLSEKNFIRCHNSHIININHVCKVSKGKSGYIELTNKDIVPIANSKKDKLSRVLNL